MPNETVLLPFTYNTDTVWGGEIILFQGAEYYVTKRARVNLQIKQISTGIPFNLPIAAKYTKVDRRLTQTERETLGLTPTAQVYKAGDFAPFKAGVVVRAHGSITKDKHWHYPADQRFVVMKHNFKLVNVVRLGGDGNQYWRISPSNLTVVTDF